MHSLRSSRNRRYTAALLLILASPLLAQDRLPSSDIAPGPVAPASPIEPPEDKRIFGVLPNNRTTENSIPFHSITPKRKFTIAFKDSFDWPVYPTAAAFAGMYHLENQNPSFDQGAAGYARRFGTAYADQIMGTFFTEALFPVLTRQDPRYFRLNEGTKKHRAWYAATAIFVTKTDSGRHAFNLSEWGGNAAAVAISNAYYPDTRNVRDNAQRLLIQCATDAFSNVLKEFWPDVKRKFKKDRPLSIAVLPAAGR